VSGKWVCLVESLAKRIYGLSNPDEIDWRNSATGLQVFFEIVGFWCVYSISFACRPCRSTPNLTFEAGCFSSPLGYYSGMEVNDQNDKVCWVRALITARGRKSFNLVGIMPERVRSFDILNPCASHHLRPYPSTSIYRAPEGDCITGGPYRTLLLRWGFTLN